MFYLTRVVTFSSLKCNIFNLSFGMDHKPISKNQARRRANNPATCGASTSASSAAPKLTQTTLFGNKVTSPRIVNVKKQNLVKLGYRDLEHWLEDPNHVYIGRTNARVKGAVGSQWGNTFSVQEFGRAGCIEKFKKYLTAEEKLLKDLAGLKGKILGCWCKPEACHGDVILEFLLKVEAEGEAMI